MISVVVISKDEDGLADTLGDLQQLEGPSDVEIVVVDASERRLEHIRQRFPFVRWIDFEPARPGVSIAAQRNEGLRATKGSEIVAFTDSGCRLERSWLRELTKPILAGHEEITAGLTKGTGPWRTIYERECAPTPKYLREAPTINLALSRRAIDATGDFDERFEYGSDVDYTWRAIAEGLRIRLVPEAVVFADWGSRVRQLRRSFRYGKARARLHLKYRTPLLTVARRDPMIVVYPLFLIGLPFSFAFPAYFVLLAIPLWRARGNKPFIVLADHLFYGAGALVEVLT